MSHNLNHTISLKSNPTVKKVFPFFRKMGISLVKGFLYIYRAGLEFFEARGDATKCALILYKKIICFHT